MSTLASALINEVRDLIPDPVYDNNGVAQPGTDGNLFRSQTLLRMMDRATKDTARKIGWVVEDWFAFQQLANQPNYALDGKWLNLTIPAYANKWPLEFVSQQYLVYPNTASTSQPTAWGLNRFTDHLEVVLFPTPNTADPTTTINQGGGLSLSSTGPLVLTSTTGFLVPPPMCYCQIDSEIIGYNSLTAATTTITGLIRGLSGTTAAAHANGATVTHLGAWIKGKRVPTDITATTSVVEVPSMAIQAVELRMLELCARSQNDPGGEGAAYAKRWDDTCMDILDDPTWRQHQGIQIPAYGQVTLGPLAWGSTVLP